MTTANWVRITKWCEMTDDTANAVHQRRKVGKWLDGRECKVVDGGIWVNVDKAMEWIEKWKPGQTQAVSN